MSNEIEREPEDELQIPIRAFNGELLLMRIRQEKGSFGYHDDVFLETRDGKRLGSFHFFQRWTADGHWTEDKEEQKPFFTWFAEPDHITGAICFNAVKPGEDMVVSTERLMAWQKFVPEG